MGYQSAEVETKPKQQTKASNSFKCSFSRPVSGFSSSVSRNSTHQPDHWPLLDQTTMSKCLMTPELSHLPELSFMFSGHSSYNLGCFSVLVISPKEICDPRVIWSHGEISGKGVSEDLRLQCAMRAGAVYIPPACLCGKSGNGLRVPGRGNP